MAAIPTFAARAIAVSATVIPAPEVSDTIGVPCLITTDPLDGASRYLLFSTTTAIDAAEDASEIGSGTAAALRLALGQDQRPTQIAVITYDPTAPANEAMPRAEWDGKALLYSEARDQYYSTPGDAAEDLEEDQTLADLRLVICEPNYVRQLEPDYCCDDLPEDGDVPDDVAEAMEAFNEAVASIVLSWSPGKKALALADDAHNA